MPGGGIIDPREKNLFCQGVLASLGAKNPLFWPKIRFFELNYHFFGKTLIFEKKYFLLLVKDAQ
jgi:hypothetical protein